MHATGQRTQVDHTGKARPQWLCAACHEILRVVWLLSQCSTTGLLLLTGLVEQGAKVKDCTAWPRGFSLEWSKVIKAHSTYNAWCMHRKNSIMHVLHAYK
jgi:hypothetical protein